MRKMPNSKPLLLLVKKNLLSPPANAPGLYIVQFDAIAGVGPVFTDAIFEFNVTDVSDPPVIDYEVESPNEINPDLANVPSYVQTQRTKVTAS